MKKIFILSIIFCLFVSLLTSCKDDGVKPEPVVEPEYTVIETISVNTATAQQLDAIFSYSNTMLKSYWSIPPKTLSELKDGYYIKINSIEELGLINPFAIQVDIDFSKYTLLGMGIYTSSYSDYHKMVSLEEKKYDYVINVSYTLTGLDSEVYGIFWGLYPKLKEEKNIVFEKIIN